MSISGAPGYPGNERTQCLSRNTGVAKWGRIAILRPIFNRPYPALASISGRPMESAWQDAILAAILPGQH